jgi:hypothetical protein
MRQLQVQRKMLNSKDWTTALMVKSRQWRDPGKHRGPNYTLESLEARLQATLNMIPAYARYAAPSTALTFMNERELPRTNNSLAVLVRIEKLSAQVRVDSGRRSPCRGDGSERRQLMRIIALAPMNSFPIRRGCTRHTTKRFGEVALIGKTVLYSDVGERVTALQ